MMRILLLAALAAAPLVQLPALAIQQQPPSPLTQGFLNGTEFVVTRPYPYIIGSTNTALVIPAGFVTDFASIPAGLRAILERQGPYSRAALLHDYLYWAQGCTRRQSDNLLMIAMQETNVPWAERQAVYRGVRLGGLSAWKSNGRERQSGVPHVVPGNMFYLADHNTWKQARAILIAKGVKDPPFVIDPSVCRLGNSTKVP
jgi:hypothetical protein